MSDYKFDTKWGERMYSRLFCSQLTHGQTNSIARRLTDLPRNAMYIEDAHRLLDEVIEVQPRVLPDSFQRGVTVLRNLFYTPKGAARRTKVMRDADVTLLDLHILDNATHIDLVDFHDIWRRSLVVYYPVFRLFGDVEGRTLYFDYIYPAWQRGDSFDLLERGSVP